jgi:hypothetical protein
MTIDLDSMTCLTWKRGDFAYSTLAKVGLGIIGSYTRQFATNGIKSVFGRRKLGHDVVISQFLRSIIDGTPPPVSFQEARDAVAVVEKIVSRLPSPDHAVQ